MSELTYMVLKFGFLALMWVFVFIVVYALRSDLFGAPVRKLVAQARERQLATMPGAGQAGAPTAPLAAGVPQAAGGMQRPAAFQPGSPADDLDLTSTADRANRDSRDASRLVITGGPKSGLEIDLPGEQLVIGRSSDAGLIIRDDYTSSHHARLLRWPDGWMIQDLDSTNGTFLDGARVHGPTYVPLHTPVTVGATTFELRR